MRKPLALAIISSVLAASSLFAIGQARITGKVVDENNKPLADVQITVISTQKKNLKFTHKTNKKGEFAVFLIEGFLPYKFTFSKQGHGTYEENIKLNLLPEKNERIITLGAKGAVPAPADAAPTAPSGEDLAAAAHNAGVALANEGKFVEALAKFEEAIKLNPTLVVSYKASAKVNASLKNWAKVIERGSKAIELNPSDIAVAALLADAYDKTGDKTKAAEFRKRTPADPAALFNEAVPLLNAGKDSEAETILLRAVEAGNAFAAAHYELGMIYARAGKNVEAKKFLSRYLELDPKGKDAGTAKEMLKYVQ